ncbi:MAG: nucleotide sugar dehydrogenase [Solirubrobacteraceae bacterium]|nr:nucleotide sugar dehydrogenase [Solirubrobacteraceae bacterium]
MTTAQRESIGVIGTGYVGLVTAVGFAELGSHAWCVDIDADKIARLERGEVPIYEPGLADAIARNRERLHFTTELREALEHARLLFVAVGTPPTHSGDADLSAVHAVVDAMPPSDRHALVMKSTVPVGTGATIKRLFEERGKDGFRYVSCPEFLKEGSALSDFLAPDRVVVGDDGDWAGDAVVELYRPLLRAERGGQGDAELVRTDIASAEMVKLASNAFLATKISFINEIANVCEETGADVLQVARGMGLDNRIGPKFLQAGIGFGGSCLVGEETVLARRSGRTRLVALSALYDEIEREGADEHDGALLPEDLEVLSWAPDAGEPLFLPVMCLTRREHDGDVLRIRTKMGRMVTCTADHPWYVSDGVGGEVGVKLADELTSADWLPIARHRLGDWEAPRLASLLSAVGVEGLDVPRILVRPSRPALDRALAVPVERRREVFASSAPLTRAHDVRRSGVLRLQEAALAEIDVRGSRLSTTKNGAWPASEIEVDEAFWRIVGLYLAEGHTAVDAGERGTTYRISWSFHPEREEHLVDEVMAFWLRHGVRARVATTPTTRQVTVQSRLLGTWWLHVLGLGRGSYEQRIPDLAWERPEGDRWAMLSGLFEGDGSWSLVGGGPSVTIELGTVSDELADGVLRMLGDLGIVASQRIGRAAKSTKDTHWLRISGADQVERAIALVPERDRPGVRASLVRQSKRIAPTGFRDGGDGTAWARVVAVERATLGGSVYSMEVPGAHSFVTTGGLITSNCFPKDVSALKQLAGNSGYHFQLLTAVIEVNELQKRRVMGKLQKNLGSLVGKRIALLGLAFKPNTDDMRQAASLVLAGRLQAAGAHVVAYDPIAEDEARGLMPGVEFADGAMDALRGADAAVLVTEWQEFRDLDLGQVAQALAGDVLIDGRNALDADAARAAGLRYEGVGRAT